MIDKVKPIRNYQLAIRNYGQWKLEFATDRRPLII
jgi:hypothetical protein